MLKATSVENPASFLQGALYDRMSRNSAYSLRAFARDLGVSHTYLSLVINGKKRISAHQAAWFADSLGFEESRKQLFTQAALQVHRKRKQAAPRSQFRELELDRMQVLSSWHYLAILDLTLVNGFQPKVAWVAKKLKLPETQVEEAVERLERLGLLKRTKDRWVKADTFLALSTPRSEACLRKMHKGLILKSVRALASSAQKDFEKRSISGALIPVDPSRLEEARKRITRFRRSLIRYLSEGKTSELYALNVQLFPLSDEVTGEELQ